MVNVHHVVCGHGAVLPMGAKEILRISDGETRQAEAKSRRKLLNYSANLQKSGTLLL